MKITKIYQRILNPSLGSKNSNYFFRNIFFFGKNFIFDQVSIFERNLYF